MTVEGSGEIIRNLSGSGGGAVSFIDDLYWSDAGSSDSDDFTITVAAGETLLISAWFEVNMNTDHDVNVIVDGTRIDPLVLAQEGTFLNQWPGTFWTRKAGLSAGDHVMGLTNEGAGMNGQGGVVVFHVPNAKIGTQHNT